MSIRRSRILIVDDHPLVRQALTLTIFAQPHLEVCGEAASQSEALQMIEQQQPDLMLVDISLKDGHGIELIKHAKARYPDLKMLVLSGFQESLYGERALRAGAAGYLNKQESQTKLVEAMQTVLQGNRYMSPDLSRRLFAQALETDEVAEPAKLLSNREMEIFRMIGQGLTSGAIANRLELSRNTIDTHRENIKRKIGARNAGELSRQAVQWLLENG